MPILEILVVLSILALVIAVIIVYSWFKIQRTLMTNHAKPTDSLSLDMTPDIYSATTHNSANNEQKFSPQIMELNSASLPTSISDLVYKY